jgi:hypothetical protein
MIKFIDRAKVNSTAKHDNEQSSSESSEHHLEEDVGQGFFDDESEEADTGDSDVSEERNPEGKLYP